GAMPEYLPAKPVRGTAIPRNCGATGPLREDGGGTDQQGAETAAGGPGGLLITHRYGRTIDKICAGRDEGRRKPAGRGVDSGKRAALRGIPAGTWAGTEDRFAGRGRYAGSARAVEGTLPDGGSDGNDEGFDAGAGPQVLNRPRGGGGRRPVRHRNEHLGGPA